MTYYDQRIKLMHELSMHTQEGDGRFHTLRHVPMWSQHLFWDIMRLTNITRKLNTDIIGELLPAIPLQHGKD